MAIQVEASTSAASEAAVPDGRQADSGGDKKAQCLCGRTTTLGANGVVFKKKLWRLGCVQFKGEIFEVALRLDRNPCRPCVELFFIQDAIKEKSRTRTCGNDSVAYLLAELVGEGWWAPVIGKSTLRLRGLQK